MRLNLVIPSLLAFAATVAVALPAATGMDTERKMAPVYVVWEGELILDAPIDQAWRHVIDYPSWQSYSTVRHVSGELGQEGEVVLLQNEDKGLKFLPYYARTIKLDPGRRVIWKIYPQEGTQGVGFFGFCEFRTDEMQGKTRFGYSLIYEFQVPYRDESELDAFRRKEYENFEALFSTILPRLKKGVEWSSWHAHPPQSSRAMRARRSSFPLQPR